MMECEEHADLRRVFCGVFRKLKSNFCTKETSSRLCLCPFTFLFFTGSHGNGRDIKTNNQESWSDRKLNRLNPSTGCTIFITFEENMKCVKSK